MTILNQVHAGNLEFYRPGRTPTHRRRLRIKKTVDGFVWFSKKGKPMTKPVPKRKQAKLKRKRILGFMKKRL